MLKCMVFAICFATPAWADFPETVHQHILPGYAAFATATANLATVAKADCTPDAVRPAFHAAFDAWVDVQHLNFGPVQQDGLGLSIAFWPDPKGSGAKSQRGLLLGDPAALAPEQFAKQSVAARGLSGLERLLYPTTDLPADPCALIRATADDLANTADLIRRAWTTGYADTLLTAGEPGNTTYLTRPEVRQVLFTQIVAGLEFLKDQRLGRPLGTFDRPQPMRAESVASQRSLTNVLRSLHAMRAMVATLTPDVPQTMAGFDRAIGLANALGDPTLSSVATPQGRLRVEILQQAVSTLRDTALGELGPELDVGIGFNAADGD